MQEVIDDVREFINKYPKEIVILDFHLFYGMSRDQHIGLVNKLKSAFGNKMAPSTPDEPFLTVAGTPIKVLWEKGYQIIVLYNDDATIQDTTINDNSTLWPANIEDIIWSNTTDVNYLLADQTNHLNLRSENGWNRFMQHGTILTPDNTMIQNSLSPFSSGSKSLQELANTTTPVFVIG